MLNLQFLTFKLVEHNYTKGGVFTAAYYWFNMIEGVLWITIGAYVFTRYLKNNKSYVEILYAALFLTFGLTDFREIQSLPIWLLLAKAIILTGILYCRHFLKKTQYSDLKI